jgi:molecular chaperone GrpE (heat shock protein)
MPVEVDAGALAEVATAVWRLRNKLRNTEDGAGMTRYVRGVEDALAGAGVETRQYDGTAFDSGLRIRVLAFEPTEGLAREEIIETVRPAVLLNGDLLRMGEVIVGTPPVAPVEEQA